MNKPPLFFIATLPLLVVGLVLNGAPATHAASIWSDERPTVLPLPTSSTAPAATDAPATTTPPARAKAISLGAHIVLVYPAEAGTPGLQAVVQWQGRNQRWYDVEGWRSLRPQSPITWWVDPADFGKGPFRWIAYRENSAQPILISQPFYLPRANQSSVVLTWNQ